MKIVGMVVVALASLLALAAILAPSDRLAGATWKARWVEERFGKAGLRIYLLIVGLLLVLVGYRMVVTGQFP